MRNLLLIYNPSSGDGSFKFALDAVIAVFGEAGFFTHVLRTGSVRADEYLSKVSADFYHTIAVSGGDGTLNIVVSACLKYGLSARIGIIPSGTANDFAGFIGMPEDPVESAKIIAGNDEIFVDIGQVNGKYFINVCAAGALAGISQQIDVDFKHALGKLAYYLKGLEQAPNLTPFRIRAVAGKDVYNEEIYLFLTLNTGGTGGFSGIVPNAAIDDGLFDFIALKAGGILDFAGLMLNALAGKHLNDPNILYFQASRIKVEILGGGGEALETDVDGEAGPALPIEIVNIPRAARFCAKTRRDRRD
ncbi:MAG: YegS/Rv2252/BmrU family lipid kinase [Clostridiales bacterium]|jgi:YegS/Rv2252/BmrU family lipid kinase|nr:YegS/Rv2252/BmrU family lipid kinase [Clostridiales bacterium]